MASINGFTVVSYGNKAIGTYIVPGTGARINVRKEIAPILIGFATDFAKSVEPLNPRTCGGHNPRYIAGTKQWSRHAPGIAMDLNWDDHPMGRADTFRPGQVTTVRALLRKWSYNGRPLIRWGAAFRRKDEMHFEIVVDRALALAAVGTLQRPAPVMRAPATPASPIKQAPGSRDVKAGCTSLRAGTGDPDPAGDVVYVQKFIGPSRAGAADGVAGDSTVAGIKWYQQMRGYPITGVWDRRCWRGLGVAPTY